MATYLKRSSKLFERLSNVNNSNNHTTTTNREPLLRELICPVCRTLLREPVTLPCAHNLCLRCLRGTVEHSNLSCPLCRQRVGSWLRSATKTETLVNNELWQLIRKRYPEAIDEEGINKTNIIDNKELELDPEFNPKKVLSAAGEIKKEYEVQLQKAEEEMRQQREKERLASEAFIKKIQEEERQQKLLQLAQDQLLAKTLAKQVDDKTNKYERTNKSKALDKSKSDVIQSKPSTNQKMSVKLKDATDIKKQNETLMSKVRSDRHMSSSKSTNVHKESSEIFSSQKPVPIHNAVTRVVTHQSRVSQPNNSAYAAALGELIGSTSKIYGLQSKEELHVPSDVLSSKKKKLGVEVCVTTIEGEERIGSAESAGSHDSINQEIHHFKPIKALPRTPLRTTLDGRQVDPKLIRVLPILKRVSNVVPKPPTPTHLKKMFGCSWSAFKRISKQQQMVQKESPNFHQQPETKKTEKKSEQSRSASKSSKILQDVEERNAEMAFDSNKNYAKNINKIINGTKVSKKLNLDDQTNTNGGNSSVKQTKRTGKLKNGLLPGKHKSQKEPIEIVEIEDDEPGPPSLIDSTPDPLACTPKHETKPKSPVLEVPMENIAERIKRRKTQRTASNTENVQSAINQVAPIERSTKVKSKKISMKGRKQKTKKLSPPAKPKVKTVTVTSQIKRLAARSTKRPRYTEDSESEEEYEKRCREELEANEEQRQLEENEVAELDKSNPNITPSPSVSPLPAKKPRKGPKSKKQKLPKKTASNTKTVKSPVPNTESIKSPTVNLQDNSADEDEEIIIQEQERLEQIAAQERKDRELALRLQASFNAMERIAGRTRRGTAARIPSPLLSEPQLAVNQKRPQKRAAMK